MLGAARCIHDPVHWSAVVQFFAVSGCRIKFLCGRQHCAVAVNQQMQGTFSFACMVATLFAHDSQISYSLPISMHMCWLLSVDTDYNYVLHLGGLNVELAMFCWLQVWQGPCYPAVLVPSARSAVTTWPNHNMKRQGRQAHLAELI